MCITRINDVTLTEHDAHHLVACVGDPASCRSTQPPHSVLAVIVLYGQLGALVAVKVLASNQAYAHCVHQCLLVLSKHFNALGHEATNLLSLKQPVAHLRHMLKRCLLVSFHSFLSNAMIDAGPVLRCNDSDDARAKVLGSEELILYLQQRAQSAVDSRDDAEQHLQHVSIQALPGLRQRHYLVLIHRYCTASIRFDCKSLAECFLMRWQQTAKRSDHHVECVLVPCKL